jgi:hypothetical protein
MATRAEVVADRTERTEEMLGVLGGLEALEHSLTFAGRQVGVLGAVVQALVASVLGRRL